MTISAAEHGWEDLRLVVYRRDHWICRAPDIDPYLRDYCSGPIELDHVKEQPMMGRKAPDDEAHLVSLCRHHHQNGWATSHREEQRAWLANRYPEVWER